MVTPINTARIMPDFSVALVSGTGASVGARLRHENLFNVFQDLAARGGVDFKIVRSSGRLTELQIAPIGTDKTYSRNYPLTSFVILDPLRGNLENPSLLFDRKDEKNYGYFLGQGPGENRIQFELAGDGQYDSPWNRIEYQEDVRQAERGDTLQLLTQARTSLKEAAAAREFTFDISGNEPGNTYRQEWVIGDRITAQWGSESVDLRIIGVEFEVNSNGESLKVITELP